MESRITPSIIANSCMLAYAPELSYKLGVDTLRNCNAIKIKLNAKTFTLRAQRVLLLLLQCCLSKHECVGVDVRRMIQKTYCLFFVITTKAPFPRNTFIFFLK